MIFLSYYLSENTPLYGKGSGISIHSDKNISHGDTCNTLNISFPNHSGTHIDLPYHFDPNGKSLNDYPPDFWEFNQVGLVDLSGEIKEGDLIGPEHLPKMEKAALDLFIIKTGFGKYRGTDKYTLTPPGVSSELADFLRSKFPNIRCIGMDLISISSFSHRDEGRKAHHAFLSSNSGNPILIIEDMKLDHVQSLKKVIVAPLMIDNADGTPCTVIGYPK